MAKVFHVMSPAGDSAGHVKQITGTDMSNSALSQRGISIISFAKVHDATVALCRVMELGCDFIDDATRAEWTRRVLAELTVTALIPTRRPRSCERGLRQPAKNSKKIRQPTSLPLVKKITLGQTRSQWHWNSFRGPQGNPVRYAKWILRSSGWRLGCRGP